MLQAAFMDRWTSGYSQAALDDAQARYGLDFPPDLVALLRERRPIQGYDWDREDHRIRKMLDWPRDGILFDVENGFWWPDWGERPDNADDCATIVSAALAAAPRLIPLFGHRFIPETPSEAGNPVFSVYGFDTIYYGENLADYVANEFDGPRRDDIRPERHIPFWTDLVERWDEGFACLEAFRAAQDRR